MEYQIINPPCQGVYFYIALRWEASKMKSFKSKSLPGSKSHCFYSTDFLLSVYEYTTGIYLPTVLLIDIWIISYFLLVQNNVAMNILVNVSSCNSKNLGYMLMPFYVTHLPMSETAVLKNVCIFTFRYCLLGLQSACTNSHLTWAAWKSSQFSIWSQTFEIVRLLISPICWMALHYGHLHFPSW